MLERKLKGSSLLWKKGEGGGMGAAKGFGGGLRMSRSKFACGILAWFVLIFVWRADLWWQQPCKIQDLLERRMGGLGRPDGSQHTPAARGRETDPKNFRLHINLMTYDRPLSAMRCLRSLRDADYAGDEVSLNVLVDFTFNPAGADWDATAEQRVHISHNLLKQLDTFEWPHGPMRVHYRSLNVGLQPQWLEAFWPVTMNDFGFIVEDDMEVSPLYYHFFKRMVLYYYYNSSNFDPSIYGISFQRQHFVPAEAAYHMHVRNGEPFLYQLVGTWGQFVFPGPWRDFRTWYDTRRYNASREPILAGMRTTGFFERKRNLLWTPWIVKWAHARGAFNLYPNFSGNLSLSVSHRDQGISFHQRHLSIGPDSRLMTPADLADNSLVTHLSLPPTTELRRIDFCAREIPWHKVAEAPDDVHALASRVQRDRMVILVIVPRQTQHMHRNWLCHIDGLGLANYILVASDREIALDLARRGHPTAYVPLREPSFRLHLWSEAHVAFVDRMLSWQFHVLVLPANSVVFGDLTRHFLADRSIDLQTHIDHDVPSASIVFLGSSDPVREGFRSLASAWKQALNHVDLLQALERATGIAHKSFAPLTEPPGNGTVLDPGTPPLYVAKATSGEEEGIRTMKRHGLWTVDDFDFACTAVVCRRTSLESSAAVTKAKT